MARPTHELAEVIRRYEKAFLAAHPQPPHHLRTLQALSHCRSASLGGHVDQCESCGKLRISYNSCRNRHCPKCQGLAQQRWVEAREADLLPVAYYHLVFTLPDKLNALCMNHPRQLYHLLFRCAWETVQTFAAEHKYLGAQPGMVGVLHILRLRSAQAWGQNLSLHPHIHAIVPGGGLSPQGKWRAAKGRNKFLFPVKAMSQVFRGKFVAGLRRLEKNGEVNGSDEYSWKELLRSLYEKPWVVYARRPFAGPEQVIRYLGRYTHRIAISNHRLRSIEAGNISFSWKDYRKGGAKKLMSLTATEFLRRYCLHILPPGFTRLRHYGFLASRNKTTALGLARESLKVKPPAKTEADTWQQLLLNTTGLDLAVCPCCKKGQMKPLRSILPTARSPPAIRLPQT